MTSAITSNLIASVISTIPGQIAIVQELTAGLSDSYVAKVSLNASPAVLKIQQHRRELDFYRHVVPTCLGNASFLADVFGLGEYAGWNWLLLEYVPHTLPRERWNYDQQALSILKTIHEAPVPLSDFDWADTDWHQGEIDYCTASLPPEAIEKIVLIHQRYESIRNAHRVLCSGDPNQPNWRVRENGQLVLLDWQTVTIANRALDLAGWIATLENWDSIAKIAATYLDTAPSDPIALDLAQAVTTYFCRRCVSIFKLASNMADRPEIRKSVESLTQWLPSWLDDVVSTGAF